MVRLPRTLALVAFLLTTGFGECQNEDAFSLLAGGYCLITPPSNLVAPGAIVMMVKDAQGRAQLQTICGPRAALSSRFLPRVSETLSATYRMSRSQRMSLQAEAVERFKTRVKTEDVQTVQVELSRPRIIEITEADVYAHVDQRTEACQRAIDSRIEAGFSPTFVTSAYIADVQYTVSFRREQTLTKRVREERMARIAGSLGGGHTEVTEHALRASNLVLAVKSDPFLLSIRPADAQPPKSTQPPGDDGVHGPMVEVLPEPLAPYVPPEGGWVNPVIGR